jgi:hypothetical protein
MPNLAATSGRSAAGLVEPQEANRSIQRIRRFKAASSFIALLIRSLSLAVIACLCR